MMSAARARNAHTAPPLVLGVISIAWLVVAWWLYQPFSPRPYDVADFPFFVPLLRASNSFVEAFAALTAYHADQGRLNLGAFALLAARWSAFGETMTGWQVSRFIEMSTLAWLLYLVLRRMGARWSGALAGPAIVLLSPAAAIAWMRMSIAEPPATILLLLMMLVMLRVRPDGRPRRHLVITGGLVILIGLTKEAILATVVVPALVLGRLADVPRAPGVRALVQDPRVWTVAGAGFVVSLPILFVALQAPADAFSRSYGGEALGAAGFALPAAVTLLPFSPNRVPLNLVLAANMLYVLVLLAGWAIVMRPGARIPTGPALLGLGLGMAVAGAVFYAPWPRYSPLYSFPFQVGTAGLVAVALSALPRRRIVATVVAAGCLLALLPAFSSVHRYTRFVRASMEASHAVALHLNSLPADHEVAFEVCGMDRALWPEFGQRLRQYAVSLGGKPPHVVDKPCSAMDQAAGSMSRVILSDSPTAIPSGARSVLLTHKRFDWSTFRATSDTLALLFVTHGARRNPSSSP
jgi:hypothetical protein